MDAEIPMTTSQIQKAHNPKPPPRIKQKKPAEEAPNDSTQLEDPNPDRKMDNADTRDDDQKEKDEKVDTVEKEATKPAKRRSRRYEQSWCSDLARYPKKTRFLGVCKMRWKKL